MHNNPFLDRIFWHALTGAHARHASGDGGARRYTAGFSPIIAFADSAAPDFAALAPHCACLLYTSPSPRDRQKSRMPSSA